MPKRDDNKPKKMESFKKTYIRNWIICIVTFILCVLLYAYSENQKANSPSSAQTEAFTIITTEILS